ncbi:uncharacterized protein LOC144180499 [Haemaphysalis longicornis]
MTFLGVRLYRHIQIQTFISAIPDVATFDTIIFQTHMTDTVSGKSACRTRFLSISAESLHGTQPSLGVAHSAVNALRQEKPNLAKDIRSLFSATLGVMIYSGTTGGRNFTRSGEECISGELRSHDELCNDKVRKATSFHSEVDMADYTLYSDEGVPYFIALESTSSLEDKVHKYAKTFNVSQGWAMFDVHLDQNKKCDDPENFERLSIFNLTLKT